MQIQSKRHGSGQPTRSDCEITMPKIIKKTLIAAIVANTGLKPGEAKRAVEAILVSMKRALADGKKLDLGKLLNLAYYS
jgi:hypothetical protein